MTGDPSQFIKFKPKSSEKVTFEDNMMAKTIGIDDIGKKMVKVSFKICF